MASLLFGGVVARVVEPEGVVDAGALAHELDRAALVGRDVAHGEHAVRQVGTAAAARQPRHRLRLQQRFGVGNCDETRRARRPVDTVDEHRRVWSDLKPNSENHLPEDTIM